jgi:D-methionine transport system ATP-binding protein
MSIHQDRVGRVLADAVRATDVGVEFVYGGISALQGKSVGNITLAFTGSESAVDQVIAQLGSQTTVQELR